MSRLLRVLYAEDSAIDADLTNAHFHLYAPQIRLEVVATAQQCLAAVATGTYDVLLLDNHLADMDGTDVLKQLALMDLALPVVMVTGSGDEALVVQVLRLGASDYIAKEGNYLACLPSVLEGAVTSFRSQQTHGGTGRTKRYRILYVEHHAADIDLTRRHFATAALHLDLQVVRSSADALSSLEREAFDLVLADLRLPDMSAVDLLRETRVRRPGVPFIVVTGKGDEETASAAFKGGAYDYIVKRDAYLHRLPYAIENAIARAQLLQANQRLQIQLAARERAETHIRQLNAALEHQVLRKTRELETANQELEDTGVLELIAQSAPLSEVCARLAALVARRTATIVSVTAFGPSTRLRAARRPGLSPVNSETCAPDLMSAAGATLAAVAIATPDGKVESAPDAQFASVSLVRKLAAAERLPSRVDFPIRSAVTNTNLGSFSLYREFSHPPDIPC